MRKTNIFRKRVSFLRILRKRRTFPKGRIYRFSKEFTKFPQKAQIFRKRVSFLRILRKDACLPWVEFVEFIKICRCPCINNPICMRCLHGPPEYPCDAHIQKKSDVLKIQCINNLNVF